MSWGQKRRENRTFFCGSLCFLPGFSGHYNYWIIISHFAHLWPFGVEGCGLHLCPHQEEGGMGTGEEEKLVGLEFPGHKRWDLGAVDQPGPGPLGPSWGTPVTGCRDSPRRPQNLTWASAHTGPVPAVSPSTCHGPRRGPGGCPGTVLALAIACVPGQSHLPEQ